MVPEPPFSPSKEDKLKEKVPLRPVVKEEVREEGEGDDAVSSSSHVTRLVGGRGGGEGGGWRRR